MAGPVTGGPVDLPHLPYSVYTYGPDGFARERLVGRNSKSWVLLSLRVHSFFLSISFTLAFLRLVLILSSFQI